MLVKTAKDAISLAKEAWKGNALLCRQLEGKENGVSSLEDSVQQYKEVMRLSTSRLTTSTSQLLRTNSNQQLRASEADLLDSLPTRPFDPPT